MSGLNKVMLIGRLGADPDTKYAASGTVITNISVATSEKWKDKNSGETQEKTEWHRITFFNRLAEIAGEYLHKGDQIYVEGRLQTDKWQDKNGEDRYTTKIIGSEMKMIGSKRDSASQGQKSEGDGFRSGGQQKPSKASAAAPRDDGFGDDDIPF